MNMPHVAATHVNPVIEELFRSLVRRDEEHWIRGHLHYADFEEAALREALRVVAEHPGHERRVWETMEASIDEANLELMAIDAPALNWVDYSTFASKLASECAVRASAA